MKNRVSVQDFRTIIRALSAAYPRDNFIPDEYSFNLWYSELQDIPYITLRRAADNYIQTNRYAPTIADMRAYANDMENAFDMLASQAWDQLLRALRYSYAPESERVWNELPEITKKCVGGYATFRSWGNTTNETLEAVQRPMFLKRFDVFQSWERTEQSLPPEVRKKTLPVIGCVQAGEQAAIEHNPEKRETTPAPSSRMDALRKRLGA